MSELCSNIERYFGKEEIDDDKINVKFIVPPNTKKNDIKLKLGENSYLIEYEKEVSNKEDGWVYHSSSTGHYMKSYPFEIKNPKASFTDGVLVLTFEKGDPVLPKHNDLEISEG